MYNIQQCMTQLISMNMYNSREMKNKSRANQVKIITHCCNKIVALRNFLRKPSPLTSYLPTLLRHNPFYVIAIYSTCIF